MPDLKVKVDSAKGDKPKPDWQQRSIAAADWLDARLGVRFWTLAALVAGGLIFGTPHMLVTYRCYIGRCTPERAYSCDYVGITGMKKGVAADRRDGCSPFVLR